MTIASKMLMGAAGAAALAAAAPAAAQYQYGYSNPQGYAYGNPYGYAGMNSQALAQRCAAAVQSELSYTRNRTGVLGQLLGVRNTGRVLSVTQANPQRRFVRVRGIATSGRASNLPYGAGAWGVLAGAQPQADLSFKCDVDYAGNIRDIDINRRR